MPRAKPAAGKAAARQDWPPRGAVDLTASFIDRARREQRPGVPAVDVRDLRGPGLVLRVSPRTISWGWKAERLGRTVRVDLGPVERLSIGQARQIAVDATDLLRSGAGWPTATWLGKLLAERGVIGIHEVFPDLPKSPDASPPKPRLWTYDKAVDAYLAAHEDEWRKAAHDDARKNLRHPVIRRFGPLAVATVTPDDLAPVLSAKARTHHRQAEAIFVRLRHFYGWLATPGPRRESGVAKGWLDDLQRPKRHKAKEGIAPRQVVRFPEMASVGLLVALARTDLLEPPFPAAVLLLAATVQRRRAICTARVEEFRAIEDGWGCWSLPPVRRKTAERGKVQSRHALPLPPPVWDAMRGQMARAVDGWVFAGMRPRRKGTPITHLSESALTHLLAALRAARIRQPPRAARSQGSRCRRYPDARR